VSENSVVEGFGKLVLGGAVGFALYYLVTGLGLGGGRGAGRGEGRGEGVPVPGETQMPPVSPPTPPPTPPAPPAPLIPPRPKDKQRLSFLMTAPTQPTLPASFSLRGDPSRTYSLAQLIGRVKTGGRSDVELKIRGDVLQGAVVSARAAIKQAGLELWDEQSGAARVSGDRGQYGARGRRS